MAATTKHPLATWAPVIVACVFGCATETQGDGLLPSPGGDSGSGGAATAGTSSTDGGSMTTAGTDSGGTTAAGGGGSSSAGTFATGGFTFGGTFSTAGTEAGGTAAGGGGAGGTAAGGGGAGGKGGSGGTGGTAAGGGGAGGKGGSGGTGGTGGTGAGGTCKTGKLAPLAASDPGNAQYPASNAIDGDPTGTRWASEQGIDNEWLQLDMGEAVTINRVVLVWENAYATDYKIQIADAAAGPFTDLYEDKAANGGTDDIATPTLKLGRGRYLRMQGVTRKLQAYGYSLYELTAYGDADETCK